MCESCCVSRRNECSRDVPKSRTWVSADHFDSVIKVRPLRLAIPIQVGVYMFKSEMIPVGSSPVKSERATS